MKRLTTYSLLAVLSSQVVYAAPDYCELNKTPRTQSSVKLPYDPNYFISADPSGKYTAVISSGDGNQLVNMESGDSHSVPGSVDPVFTPDGRFLTLPGGKFYDMRDIGPKVDRGRDADDVNSVIDAREGGVYQSVGILPGSNERKKTYRYMDDSAGASFFDVEVEFNSAGKVTGQRRLNESVSMCPEASNRDTPMLSKDGKYLSILNFETYTTQIWRVESDGSCKMMVDTGVPTGKVDFDFSEGSEPKITFHVDQARNDWRYFSGISGGQNKSVFVMKLDIDNKGGNNEKWKVNSMAKIVSPSADAGKKGTGSYYPRFRSDGTLVTVTGDGSDYYLDTFDANSLNYQAFDPELFSGRVIVTPTCSVDTQEAFAAQAALGWLWADVCSNFADSLRTADIMLLPLGMDANKCRELIEKKWLDRRDDFRTLPSIPNRYEDLDANEGIRRIWQDPRRNLETSRVIQLSKEDLIAACPSATGVNANDNNDVIGGNGDHGPATAEGIVSRRCIGCHESRNITLTQDGPVRSTVNGPFIDFSKINTAEDAMVWRMRVFNPQPRSAAMPPPTDFDGDGQISEQDFQRSLRENFTEEERNTLQQKLLEIEQGSTQWNWRH